MPAKKVIRAGDGVEPGGKLVWEGANDTKLLLLTQGRYVKPDEYDQLSSAFNGATTGSIRNRISALRVKQRDLYESLGWDLPSGGAGHSSKKTPSKPSKSTTATPKSTGKSSTGKRNFVVGSDDDDDDADMGLETPSKKPCKVNVYEGKKGLGLKREVKKECDYGYGSEEEIIVPEFQTPKGYYGLDGDNEE